MVNICVHLRKLSHN